MDTNRKCILVVEVVIKTEQDSEKNFDHDYEHSVKPNSVKPSFYYKIFS